MELLATAGLVTEINCQFLLTEKVIMGLHGPVFKSAASSTLDL